MFYKGDASLFFPATNYIGHHPSGIDAGEFPLIAWGVSGLYRIFGFHDAIFRHITFMFSVVGFWFAADISRKRIPNTWLALFVATGWLFSTNLIYYSVGFLPDMVAISAFLGGIWAGLGSGKRSTIAGLVMFSVAILLKFNILLLYTSWAAAGLWAQEARFFSRNTLRQLPQVLLPILPGTVWIFWTWHLKSVYQGHVFTTSTRIPDTFSSTLNHAGTFWSSYVEFLFPHLLGILWGILILGLGTTGIVQRTRFGTATLLSFCGWMLFFWAMGHLSPHHHYYHLILGPILFLTLMELSGKPTVHTKMGQTSIGISLMTLIGWGAFFLPSTMRKTAFHIDGIHSGWYSAAAFLDNHQIPADAPVFTYIDASPNISLYLMQRKGINGNRDYPVWYLAKCMQQCEYAVLTDPEIFRNAQLSPYLESYLGEHEGLHLYKLRHGNLTPVP